ncbi:SseB family protein [Kitasatospora sp. NPDC057692]|uniref:SseB family protein n=1 Tax=Kitasatospora sp. NPDC057692 TaxID=3346215 RepID=UPI00369EF801
MANEGLVHQVRMLRAGAGDPAVMLAQFRLSAVLVPRWGEDSVWTADGDGLRWILAFTSEAELAAWARAKGLPAEGLPYLAVLGSRLLDVAVPGLGMPGGIALDVAGAEPMLFPPVRGIVPDAAALDGPSATTGGVDGWVRS